MCGIAGFWMAGGNAQERAQKLEAMCRVQRHRGPDGHGTWYGQGVGLGHQRLSIIDLTAGGYQPMSDPRGEVHVTFNGEIYNFPELRSELEALGHVFKSRSDTEVLLHGYLAWGEAVVPKLNGMFAFAIWDARSNKLFIARDRLGKKPLFYTQLSGLFLFASELKSLLVNPEVPRNVNPKAIDAYLSLGYIPAPLSILSSVHKLRAGHTLTVDSNGVRESRYWDVEYRIDESLNDEETATEKLESLLQAAVKRRLLSDVPLGAFLSGGLDSSIVVAMMTKVSTQKVRTYTIRFDEGEFSEAEDARLLAEALGTEHMEFTVRSETVKMLPDLAYHLDEPFADSSALPTYYVSKAAREHVTVILSGDGGDELFAGYRSYLKRDEMSGLAGLPSSLRQGVLGPLGRALPFDFPGRNRLVAAAAIKPEYGARVFEEFPYIKDSLLDPAFASSIAGAGSWQSLLGDFTGLPKSGSLSQWQYIDTKLYLPDDILVKVDRMSMAVSLETRAPLLDFTLAEFAATLPQKLLLRDGRGKYLLRKVASRLLPATSLTKPKQGFAIPRDQWFRSSLKAYAREILLDPLTLGRGYFRPEKIKLLLDRHASGKGDYGFWIWALIQLELWHRTFIDSATRRI